MKTPVPVMPVQKKPIQINTALINSLYHALLKTDLSAESKELGDELKSMVERQKLMDQTLLFYRNTVKGCETKSYSTDDQKNAGCLGTDTLDQCSIKLFHHCLGGKKPGNDDSLAGLGAKLYNFPNSKKYMLEAADRLEKALKAYTVKLKMIPDPPK